jgi:hypothetical protein
VNTYALRICAVEQITVRKNQLSIRYNNDIFFRKRPGTCDLYAVYVCAVRTVFVIQYEPSLIPYDARMSGRDTDMTELERITRSPAYGKDISIQSHAFPGRSFLGIQHHENVILYVVFRIIYTQYIACAKCGALDIFTIQYQPIHTVLIIHKDSAIPQFKISMLSAGDLGRQDYIIFLRISAESYFCLSETPQIVLSRCFISVKN